MTSQLQESQVHERIERRPDEKREARRYTSPSRKGVLLALTALIVAGTVAAVLSSTLGRGEPASASRGWGLEQTELDMIATRLAPRAPLALSASASVWDLSPEEVGFITGRVAAPAPAAQRFGIGDLDPIELEFITGRSAPSEQSTGRWGLSPEEMELISG